MTKAKWQKIIRKSHRYLGLFLGIQFLFWTIGGLYFSWTNIKNIRGEDIRKEPTTIKKEKLGNIKLFPYLGPWANGASCGLMGEAMWIMAIPKLNGLE